MSEPDAGSDLASLRTKGVSAGDEFVVDGQKIWTSFANVSDFCYLICRTSNDGPKHRGISELIVPMNSPGVTVKPIRDLSDGRHFCEVWFEGVRVPATNLVGVEGESFSQTMRQLEHERGGIDRLLSNYALYRQALAVADLGDRLIRQEVAGLETGYRLGRLLVIRETLGQAPRGFSAATKTFCTEHEQRVAQFAARVLGVRATLWSPEAQEFCYHPAYTIAGGTANVLRNVLGERLLGLPKEPS
jgi:alkylation response protein AidB-like acyl-CoA dehydrogenase